MKLNKILLLWNYWANLNQTLLKWSLGGPLSKLCPSAPSCFISIMDFCWNLLFPKYDDMSMSIDFFLYWKISSSSSSLLSSSSSSSQFSYHHYHHLHYYHDHQDHHNFHIIIIFIIIIITIFLSSLIIIIFIIIIILIIIITIFIFTLF